MALHESFSTFVAEVVEITFRSGSDFTVDRVVCAVDCGIAINPDQIRAQMEGGIGFGLGAILQEELTLTKGVVDQENYDTYTPLRIEPDAPRRGAHRAFRRAAHRSWRAWRAADRARRRQCTARGDGKDHPEIANRQGLVGVKLVDM